MSDQEIDALRERWEADPSRSLTLELAGEYRRRGQADLAVEVLAAGLEVHPQHVAARVAKGRCHLELDQAEEAGRELKKVMLEDPAHLVANRLLTEVHVRLGDPARARDHLDLFELLGGDSAEVEALERLLDAPPVRPEEAEAPAPEESEAAPAEPQPALRAEEAEAAPAEELAAPGAEEPEVLEIEEPEVLRVEEPAALEAAEPEVLRVEEAEVLPVAEPEVAPAAEPEAERPAPAEAVTEPFELPAAAAAAATRLDAAEAPAPAPSSAGRDGDPDPFVLLDWIELDESKYAAALLAEGLFSSPSGAGPAVQPPAATAAAEAAAAPPAEEPAPTLTLAELYRKQGHRREAAGIFRQILERRPGNLEAARALGELEKEESWPLSAEDLLGGGTDSPPTGGGRSVADLLRRYRDRLRGGQ